MDTTKDREAPSVAAPDVVRPRQKDELPTDGAGVVREAAQENVPHRDDDERIQSATDFLLSAFHDERREITQTLIINVGGVGNDRKEVSWTIKALPGPLVRKIREDSEAVVRRAGGTGAGVVSSSFQAAVRYLIEASVDPNLKQLARQTGIADPAAFLEEALNLKQGLIEQISGKILALSGYDADDVQDAIEIRATGNFSN
jgi:hypothetical protein